MKNNTIKIQNKLTEINNLKMVSMSPMEIVQAGGYEAVESANQVKINQILKEIERLEKASGLNKHLTQAVMFLPKVALHFVSFGVATVMIARDHVITLKGETPTHDWEDRVEKISDIQHII